MTRKIIHIDMDAFFASVEQRDEPELRGKPVIVGGRPERRGVVAACSYEARKFGIHSAMSSSRAIQLCKEAIFIAPRFEAYREASSQIHAIFNEFTKLIEPLSLDEAYLDVTEKAQQLGSATAVAVEIKRLIKERVNLTASAGISYNKFLAKIASDMDKPDGIYVIRPESAQAFIEQLDIRKFYGVGKVTEKKMHALKIFNGADLKKKSEIELQTHFGKSGSYYYNVARGIDMRPVKAHRVRKSIGCETTFEGNVINKQEVWNKLIALAERVEKTLDEKQLCVRTITLKVKYADFNLITRSVTNPRVIETKKQIMEILPNLLKKTEVGKRPIRLIGISASNLIAKKHNMTAEESVLDHKNRGGQLGLF